MWNSSESGSHLVMSDSLWPHGLSMRRLPGDPRLLCPWNSPGNKTGMGCYFLLQGLFQTQWSNLGLLRFIAQVLYRQRTREQRVNFRSSQDHFSLGSVSIFTSPTSMRFWYVCMLHCIQLFVTSWTVAHQAPLSMGFSRYWSGLLCPPPGIFPTQGSNPCLSRLLYLLHWQAGSSPLVSTWEAHKVQVWMPMTPWPASGQSVSLLLGIYTWGGKIPVAQDSWTWVTRWWHLSPLPRHLRVVFVYISKGTWQGSASRLHSTRELRR